LGGEGFGFDIGHLSWEAIYEAGCIRRKKHLYLDEAVLGLLPVKTQASPSL
jgi:hypothetical protein